MLRVEMSDGTNAVIMRLEGRLCGEYAQHVRTLIRRCNLEMGLVVDLTKVTFVDSVGESVLSLLERLGADFVAENAYSLNLCERLHLPLAFPSRRPRRTAGTLGHRCLPWPRRADAHRDNSDVE